jgi:hypothetical protein
MQHRTPSSRGSYIFLAGLETVRIIKFPSTVMRISERFMVLLIETLVPRYYKLWAQSGFSSDNAAVCCDFDRFHALIREKGGVLLGLPYVTAILQTRVPAQPRGSSLLQLTHRNQLLASANSLVISHEVKTRFSLPPPFCIYRTPVNWTPAIYRHIASLLGSANGAFWRCGLMRWGLPQRLNAWDRSARWPVLGQTTHPVSLLTAWGHQ